MTAALTIAPTLAPTLALYQREAEAGALAPNTLRALRADTTLFAAWCAERGLSSLPATPSTLAAYLDACAATRSTATIRRYAASIGAHHRAAGLDSPTQDEHVRLVLRRIVRTKGARQNQARAMTREVLDAILGAIAASADLRSIRDRSLLMVAYDTLARRSELAEMRAEDIANAEDGSGTILIRRSKTDQDGAGSLAYLAPDTMRALRSFLGERTEGLIWRLSAGQIARVIHARGEAVGVDGLSGHSARVGAAQDQAAAGCELPEIMQAGRWKSPTMPARYIEQQTAQKSASAKLAKKQGRT